MSYWVTCCWRMFLAYLLATLFYQVFDCVSGLPINKFKLLVLFFLCIAPSTNSCKNRCRFVHRKRLVYWCLTVIAVVGAALNFLNFVCDFCRWQNAGTTRRCTSVSLLWKAGLFQRREELWRQEVAQKLLRLQYELLCADFIWWFHVSC